MADAHAEQLAQHDLIALPPVLRAENADHGDDNAKYHVLHELDLRRQRDGRHGVLIDTAEHDRVRRRHHRQHEILQGDRSHYGDQLPIERLVVEQSFQHGIIPLCNYFP